MVVAYEAIASDDTKTPAAQLAARIRRQLDNGRSVLWLVSGGSSIQVAVQARELLGELQKKRGALQVALIDERFGKEGHTDSNATQLLQAGFVASGLSFHPVLVGADIVMTSNAYAAKLEQLMDEADVSLGLFGMGADGHTAGLLPNNPLMNSKSLVGWFNGADYQRITVTPRFIAQLDEAVLYAVGRSKWPIVKNLDTTELPVSCLNDVPRLTVYSDRQKGEA